MPVNNVKLQLEVNGKEKLKECADNVIDAFIIMNEAIEELSGCMLELKVSDPDVNEDLVTEVVDMEDKTTVTTASETKEVFNAEEIVKDMILKLKEKFDESSSEKCMPGAFQKEMILSKEIRKLIECLMTLENTQGPLFTPEIGVCDVSGWYAQIQENQSLQAVECYEIESLDQIVQVAIDLTINLVKKDSKTYEDVFGNFKKIKEKLRFINEEMDDVKRLLLSRAEKMLDEEMKQTKVLLKG